MNTARACRVVDASEIKRNEIQDLHCPVGDYGKPDWVVFPASNRCPSLKRKTCIPMQAIDIQVVLITHTRKKSCRGRDRTSTGPLAAAQNLSGQPWSTHRFWRRIGSMQCLSGAPHPRDKRACLPKISSPHSVKNKSRWQWAVGKRQSEISRVKSPVKVIVLFLLLPLSRS